MSMIEKLGAAVVITSLFLGTFLLSTPRGVAQSGVPAWSIGDYWDYRGQVSFPGGQATMRLRFETKERQEIVLAGVSYQTYHCNVSLVMEYGTNPSSMTGDVHFTVSSIGVAKIQMTSVTNTTTKTYDPPLVSFRFPLANGQTWTSTSVETTTVNGNQPTNETIAISYSVADSGEIVVPAGVFGTVLVTQSGSLGVSGMSYYSDKVGFVVKMAGMVVGMESLPVMELVAYRHQQPSPGDDSVITMTLVVIIAVAIIAVWIGLRRKARRASSTPPRDVALGQTLPQAPNWKPQTPPRK